MATVRQEDSRALKLVAANAAKEAETVVTAEVVTVAENAEVEVVVTVIAAVAAAAVIAEAEQAAVVIVAVVQQVVVTAADKAAAEPAGKLKNGLRGSYLNRGLIYK